MVCFKITLFAKERKQRRWGVFQCALGGSSYTCCSGLQFYPNAFFCHYEETPLWFITWLGWPCSSAGSFTSSPLRFVLRRSGCTRVSEYLALTTLQVTHTWFLPHSFPKLFLMLIPRFNVSIFSSFGCSYSLCPSWFSPSFPASGVCTGSGRPLSFQLFDSKQLLHTLSFRKGHAENLTPQPF